MAVPTPENPAAEPSAAEAAAVETAPAAPAGDADSELAAALEAAGEAGGTSLNEFSDAAAVAGKQTPEIDLSQLPLHTRSLLKVKVAVTVTLAQQRRPIHEIIELGPGTIVKFEKTYDEPLELTVGDLPIAAGDVVKVGDKFGLRIGRIIRPHERFATVGESR